MRNQRKTAKKTGNIEKIFTVNSQSFESRSCNLWLLHASELVLIVKNGSLKVPIYACKLLSVTQQNLQRIREFYLMMVNGNRFSNN